ncbi:MAG TPA: hypothetical protein VFY96_12865 [Candidatus Binatia bacterium]|nr:hypothetical protein [Candidatus Binatia bacterium]
MTRALGRISLVLFLTVAVGYQSWSVIVPPDSTDFLFTATPAPKLIPSLFDIEDEHRGAHASLSILPPPLILFGASVLLAQTRGHFFSELRFNYSTLQTMSVVLLI